MTPWETTLPGVVGSAANNPSLRLFKYERDTGSLIDIWQYYLNLTEANLAGVAHWEIEYKATETYGECYAIYMLQQLHLSRKTNNLETTFYSNHYMPNVEKYLVQLLL